MYLLRMDTNVCLVSGSNASRSNKVPLRTLLEEALVRDGANPDGVGRSTCTGKLLRIGRSGPFEGWCSIALARNGLVMGKLDKWRCGANWLWQRSDLMDHVASAMIAAAICTWRDRT